MKVKDLWLVLSALTIVVEIIMQRDFGFYWMFCILVFYLSWICELLQNLPEIKHWTTRHKR